MKLFYGQGTCSLGIHVILEEIGKPYELQELKLRQGENTQPPFVAINPKMKVPTLIRDDGSVLTEFQTIAYYLGRSNPDAGLWPEDLATSVRVLEVMDYVVATIHMQGFSRMFRPSNFATTEADFDAVKARGRSIVDRGLSLIDAGLAGKDYVAGAFSVADAALFYVEFWEASRLKGTLPPNCDARYRRMLARPAVARALAQENLG